MPTTIDTIPEGTFAIFPDGPYSDGQEVTLLADDSPLIDLFNSAPRLCARVDALEEVCDPTWVRPQPLATAPPGLQGVTVELPRFHFGPTGDRDCADPTVRCRMIWRTETGTLLWSSELAFTATPPLERLSLVAMPGEKPGEIVVQPIGLDIEVTVADVFSAAQLKAIEDDVSSVADFDIEKGSLTWSVSAFCGFGPGEPTIGSEDLENQPSWWNPPTLDPAADSSVVRSFFGTTCDWLAVTGPGQLTSGEPVTVELRRDIYGFGGWIDCAVSACYLELVVDWSYPMPDGSTLGNSLSIARVLVDVPDTWPQTRPTIRIVEPEPYTPGQEIVVEVRDHASTQDGLAIGWCPGGDAYCRYRFSDYEDGVHRATITIPNQSSNCGSNRCYVEIDSQSEGLAPPAIAIVPITSS